MCMRLLYKFQYGRYIKKDSSRGIGDDCQPVQPVFRGRGARHTKHTNDDTLSWYLKLITEFSVHFRTEMKVCVMAVPWLDFWKTSA
jgi:hypothetical protein